MSFEQTNSIKGFFILFVFIRHVLQYVQSSGYLFASIGDKQFVQIDHALGQLIVVMFLFYSGYGVMESIKKKGNSYVKSIPKKRILPTLINFDIAVLCFLFVDFILPNVHINPSKIVWALLGWTSIGNSNWYILDIILCYLIVWLVYNFTFKQHPHSQSIHLILTFALLAALLIFLKVFQHSWWYDTLFCFGFGMIWSSYRNQIHGFIQSHYTKVFIAVAAIFIGLRILNFDILHIKYNVLSCAFAALCVITTMKVRLSNSILQWLGTHLFPLYIYQRITMLCLYEMDEGIFVRNHPVAYMLLCFIAMVLIAYFYKFWQYAPSKKN